MTASVTNSSNASRGNSGSDTPSSRCSAFGGGWHEHECPGQLEATIGSSASGRGPGVGVPSRGPINSTDGSPLSQAAPRSAIPRSLFHTRPGRRRQQGRVPAAPGTSNRRQRSSSQRGWSLDTRHESNTPGSASQSLTQQPVLPSGNSPTCGPISSEGPSLVRGRSPQHHLGLPSHPEELLRPPGTCEGCAHRKIRLHPCAALMFGTKRHPKHAPLDAPGAALRSR